MARKYGAKVAAGASALAFTGLALAQSTAIDEKITESGTNMTGWATAIVGIMVAVWGIKKAGQKMGWW